MRLKLPTNIAEAHARIGLRKKGKRISEVSVDREVDRIRSAKSPREIDSISVSIRDVIRALESGDEVKTFPTSALSSADPSLDDRHYPDDMRWV